MKNIYIILLSIIALSCGGSDDGSGPSTGDGGDNPDGGGDSVEIPTSASLVFPLESSICTEASIAIR